EVLPGAVFTRVASSHVRVGTFQFFYAREDVEALKSLAAFVIGRHYPEAGEAENRYEALLEAVIRSQASLIARWMQLGFIHGVMNTDNMAISGETIDYGPCAFMDRFNPETVFSSIDRQGRYAWINQPVVANWNLARFAETLLSLLVAERDEAVAIAEAHLKDFQAIFEENYFTGFAKKLSLDPAHEQVRPFVEKTLGLMADAKVDFTGFFTELTRFCRRSGNGEQPEVLPSASGWEEWWAEWQELRKRDEATWEAMRLSNPVRLPRNHRVEEAIVAATAGDFSMFHRCVEAWKHPFEEDTEFEEFELPPTPEERVTETFCGT
ncbi:MAG: protein adenylyltransferase SelO family protein, partial [Verrucomicrobiota bacterium]